MLTLYKYSANFDSMGELHGLFIEDSDVVKEKLGDGVVGASFDEVLGKNSEINDDISIDSLKVLSTNPLVIAELESAAGSRNIVGYNPLNYLQDWS